MTNKNETLLKSLNAKRDANIVRWVKKIVDAPQENLMDQAFDTLNMAYSRGYEQACIEHRAYGDEECFEDDECVFKVMKAQMSPEAIATIADALSACHTTDVGVDKELRWLVGNLIRNLGGTDAQEGLTRIARPAF